MCALKSFLPYIGRYASRIRANYPPGAWRWSRTTRAIKAADLQSAPLPLRYIQAYTRKAFGFSPSALTSPCHTTTGMKYVRTFLVLVTPERFELSNSCVKGRWLYPFCLWGDTANNYDKPFLTQLFDAIGWSLLPHLNKSTPREPTYFHC